MKTIAHIVCGQTKVGAISSVKRIIRNYSFDDTKLILISYGAPATVPGYPHPEDVYFLNLKNTEYYEKYFAQKWNLVYLFLTVFSFFTDIFKLSAFCRKQNVSIIHVHHYIDAFHYCILSLFGFKFVTHIRGVLNRKLFLGIPFVLYRFFIYRFSDAAVGISKASLSVLGKENNPKNVIIYNGLEGKEASPNEELQKEVEGSFVVASVIRFKKGKGIFFLAETVVEFFRKHPSENLKFLLIAPIQNDEEKVCRNQFLQILKDHGVYDRFLYFDYFPDYTYFMPYIDLLFHPTLEREGFGNVVLEANWFGKPVVSTPCLGVNDIIEQGVSGYILSSTDVQEAVDCIYRVYADKDLYASLSDRSYAIAHLPKFSIAESMRSLHTLYTSI